MKSTKDLIIEMLDFIGREVEGQEEHLDLVEAFQNSTLKNELIEDEITIICDWTASLVEETKADQEWYAVIADVLAFPLEEAA